MRQDGVTLSVPEFLAFLTIIDQQQAVWPHIYSLDKEIGSMFLSEEVCIVCHDGSFRFFLGCDVLVFYVKVIIGEGGFVGQLFLMAVGEVAP